MKHLYSSFFIIFCLSACLNLKKNIQKSDDHHKMAIGLLQQCDHRRALSHLLKAIKLNSRDFIIRNTLAATYYSIKEYQKAISEYNKMLKMNPDLTEARMSLARIYIDLNQLDKAFRQIQKSEEDITYTDRVKLMTYKALVNYKKKNYQLAKKYFNQSLSFASGKTCFNYIYYGKTEMALDNLEESEKILKEAVLKCKKEKPLCKQAQYDEYLVLSQLYIKKEDKKRAKYYLRLFLDKIKDKKKRDQAETLLKSIS
ncbi:MAG: tetratricopeptide repeat protein [Bdellovibrionaceae bacterium]|nr:tetratricopeptide repeat protein [Pseudobdellovibrionaceae bacterium]